MSDQFIDFYELMQISPNAEPNTITRVFRMLAARFHPDNAETGDMAIFLRLNDAYKVLSDADARAKYDEDWKQRRQQPIGVFTKKEFSSGFEGESNKRMGILTLLYNKRRTDPESPGVSVLELESTMAFPREHLVFTMWYLKDKQMIAQTETSDFEITGVGVDYVEQHLPQHQSLYKLLKASEEGAAQDAGPAPWPKDFDPSAGS
jgi:curved DNA-binding protein CbpA